MAASLIDLESLAPLFRPRSIAILGASSSPTKIGGRPVAGLLANRYEGRIFPVNPNAGTIQGLPAYPSILEVPEPVDLAICSVPAPLVLEVLGQCAEKGVRSVVIFSSGFAEVDEQGRAAQERIAALAREAGMRILGPNCMGIVNFNERAIASFHPAFSEPVVAGSIGLVSQSGAFGGLSYQLAREQGQALSYMLTTGNEADVDIADCTAFLAGDPHTKAILLYMEGCRNGPRFIEALELAREAGKPVIAVKLGRTAAGAAAAASHTAALAGEDRVYDALFRQHGVYRASSIEEFFDVAHACVVGPLPASRRVGLVTVSGGVGVLMADDAVRRGLEVTPMPESAQRRLRELVPFAGPRNPIDVTGQILNDPTLLGQAIELVVEEADYGSVIAFQGSAGRNPALQEHTRAEWLRRRQTHPEKLFAVSGFCSPDYVEALEEAGIPVFAEPTHATRAVAAMAAFAEMFAARRPAPALPAPTALPEGPLTEPRALAILEEAGVPVVAHALARSGEEAAQAAARLGYPVVLKIVSPDITHKSDIGGVALGLADGEAVRSAFEAIMARAREAAPEAELEGVLVAPMLSGGVETILGVQRDPVFGPVVMFGLGGIFVEALEDVTFRVAPFDAREAEAMIREVRAFRLLEGVRGQPPADIDALAQTLSRLSVFAAANRERLESLDVNPFLVRPRGQGGVALDAVVITR